MATKKKSTTEKAGEPSVTRITARDDSANSSTKRVTKEQTSEVHEKRRNPFRAISDYFAGAWYELRQVRWPNRRATWGMTAALLGFTAFFVVVILLLDALFKYLFQLILG